MSCTFWKILLVREVSVSRANGQCSRPACREVPSSLMLHKHYYILCRSSLVRILLQTLGFHHVVYETEHASSLHLLSQFWFWSCCLLCVSPFEALFQKQNEIRGDSRLSHSNVCGTVYFKNEPNMQSHKLVKKTTEYLGGCLLL